MAVESLLFAPFFAAYALPSTASNGAVRLIVLAYVISSLAKNTWFALISPMLCQLLSGIKLHDVDYAS